MQARFYANMRTAVGMSALDVDVREVDTLRKYGGDGKDELKQLIAAVHAAAAQLDGAGTGTATKW